MYFKYFEFKNSKQNNLEKFYEELGSVRLPENALNILKWISTSTFSDNKYPLGVRPQCSYWGTSGRSLYATTALSSHCQMLDFLFPFHSFFPHLINVACQRGICLHKSWLKLFLITNPMVAAIFFVSFPCASEIIEQFVILNTTFKTYFAIMHQEQFVPLSVLLIRLKPPGTQDKHEQAWSSKKKLT